MDTPATDSSPAWASRATSMDQLLDQTNDIVKFSDDLVSSLDSPIDVPAMKDALKGIRTSLTMMHSTLDENDGGMDRMAEQLSAVQLQSDPQQDSITVILQHSLTIIDGLVK